MGEQLPRLLMNLAAAVLVYHHHHHRRQRRHHHYHHKNNRQHLLNNSKLLRLLMKIKAPQLLCDGWLTARPEQSFLRIFFTGYMLPSLSQPSMVNINPHTSPHHTEGLLCGFVCMGGRYTMWYLTGTLLVSKVSRPTCWCGLGNLATFQSITNGWLWWKGPVSKRFVCGQYSKHFASIHRKSSNIMFLIINATMMCTNIFMSCEFFLQKKIPWTQPCCPKLLILQSFAVSREKQG